jgi:hypothetical protein
MSRKKSTDSLQNDSNVKKMSRLITEQDLDHNMFEA